MALVSEDIFYEVKKEILDKLDIILQKINIQIINYIKPQEDEFNFIELSYFQKQITHLFTYLDRLYASLNSSVSFSSIQSYKESAENYQVQNQKLTTQNLKLKKIMEQMHQNDKPKSRIISPASNMQLFQIVKTEIIYKMQPLNRKIMSLSQELFNLTKTIKKMLKNYKFQMLEHRVQIISKLKDWQQHKMEAKNQLSSKIWQNDIENHLHKDGLQIIQALQEIISIG